MPNDHTSKTKPVHEVKAGRMKAVIWPNETASGTRYNVTYTRLYKQDETWKSTASFGARDLADVVRATVLAEVWIREHTPNSEERAA